MAAATTPEIQRASLTTAMLYLKSLPLDIDVLNFDFLDPPSVLYTLMKSEEQVLAIATQACILSRSAHHSASL